MSIDAVIVSGPNGSRRDHETLCGRRAFHNVWEPVIRRLGLKTLSALPGTIYVAANDDLCREFRLLAEAFAGVADPVFVVRATRIADSIQAALDAGGGTVHIDG